MPRSFLLSLLAAASTAGAASPNVVFILADDLGYGDVSCLNPGRGKIPTPHLDRLAAEGMTFTDAHSGSSVCTPTRYGLLTGRHCWRTRLQKGVLDGGNGEPLISAGRLTLPGFLKQQGYTTACIGKWHLGFLSETPAAAPSAGKARGKGFGSGGLPVGARILGGPVERGFDEFWGCSNARTMSSLIVGDRVVEHLEPVQMLPRLERRAVGWIGEKAAAAREGRPFFLYLPLTSPHTPILPAPEWRGKSGLGDYGDFVMQTDAVAGSVLAALEEHGLARNTLVVFTSDNGCSPQAGTDKLEKQGHFASAGFRGYKADIWDGGHRVPFLVRWPGKVRPGSRSAHLLCLTDFMATCAELLGAGLPAAAAVDSVSFLPVLLGGGETPGRDVIVHHSISGKFAIRDARWKLAFCEGSGGWSKGKAENPQLYDMREDPGETRNLAGEQPGVVVRLSARLREIIETGRGTPGPPQSNDVEVDSPFC